MSSELLNTLPVRRGHFLLESGYHTDQWLTLDTLFVDPVRVAPLVAALSTRIGRHRIDAVCGPLVGGAFLAQAVATGLEVDFYYTEVAAVVTGGALFEAEYRLSAAVLHRVRDQRVAVVDDVISAGSSVRSSLSAVTAAGGVTVAVGALLIVGDVATKHFADSNIPVEALERRDLVLWKPDACPLCRDGQPLEDPRKSSEPGSRTGGTFKHDGT